MTNVAANNAITVANDGANNFRHSDEEDYDAYSNDGLMDDNDEPSIFCTQ